MKFLITTIVCLMLLMSSVFVVSAEISVGGPGSTGISTDSGEAPSFPNPFKDKENTGSIYGFVKLILEKIVMPIASVVVVFFVIYSGFLFVTANGNEEKLKKAKKTFWAVIIGAVILLGSVVIANAIKGTLCQIIPSIPGLCDPGN
jgi:hypothetical protein